MFLMVKQGLLGFFSFLACGILLFFFLCLLLILAAQGLSFSTPDLPPLLRLRRLDPVSRTGIEPGHPSLGARS